MTSKELTQHEKTLVIARVMYPDDDINIKNMSELEAALAVGYGAGKRVTFNPYTSAEDSQAVQKHFKLDVAYLPDNDKWIAMDSAFSWTVEGKDSDSESEDLKEAIADCAYLICQEKK